MGTSKYQPLGRWIRVEKRLAIYLRDRWTCLYCGRDLESADEREVTLDHIIPKSAGGGNDPSNIYTCCLECNSKRGDAILPLEVLERAKKNCSRPIQPYIWKAKKLLKNKEKT